MRSFRSLNARFSSVSQRRTILCMLVKTNCDKNLYIDVLIMQMRIIYLLLFILLLISN